LDQEGIGHQLATGTVQNLAVTANVDPSALMGEPLTVPWGDPRPYPALDRGIVAGIRGARPPEIVREHQLFFVILVQREHVETIVRRYVPCVLLTVVGQVMPVECHGELLR
jgi:hypothetical protein